MQIAKAPVAAWHKSLSCISLCYQADFAQILRFNIRWWLVVATVDADLLLVVIIIDVWLRSPHCNMVQVDTWLEVNWQTGVIGCIIQLTHSICITPNYYFTHGFPYFSFPAFSIPAFSTRSDFVPHFPFLHFPALYFCATFSSLAFSNPCKSPQVCAAFSSPAFSCLAFSASPLPPRSGTHCRTVSFQWRHYRLSGAILWYFCFSVLFLALQWTWQ